MRYIYGFRVFGKKRDDCWIEVGDNFMIEKVGHNVYIVKTFVDFKEEIDELIISKFKYVKKIERIVYNNGFVFEEYEIRR